MKLLLIAALMLFPCNAIAGHIGGARSLETTVAGGHSDYYDLLVRPREDLEIMVRGNGTSDLDCFLYNADGQLVAKDDDATDTCLIGGLTTGVSYRLYVRNVGTSVAAYRLDIN